MIVFARANDVLLVRKLGSPVVEFGLGEPCEPWFYTALLGWVEAMAHEVRGDFVGIEMTAGRPDAGVNVLGEQAANGLSAPLLADRTVAIGAIRRRNQLDEVDRGGGNAKFRCGSMPLTVPDRVLRDFPFNSGASTLPFKQSRREEPRPSLT